VFEYRCCTHVLEQELALVGYHALCLAVKEFTIQLGPVTEDYQNVRALAKIMM